MTFCQSSPVLRLCIFLKCSREVAAKFCRSTIWTPNVAKSPQIEPVNSHRSCFITMIGPRKWSSYRSMLTCEDGPVRSFTLNLLSMPVYYLLYRRKIIPSVESSCHYITVPERKLIPIQIFCWPEFYQKTHTCHWIVGHSETNKCIECSALT